MRDERQDGSGLRNSGPVGGAAGGVGHHDGGGTYIIRARCRHCGWSSNIRRVRFAVAVPTCPSCGKCLEADATRWQKFRSWVGRRVARLAGERR